MKIFFIALVTLITIISCTPKCDCVFKSKTQEEVELLLYQIHKKGWLEGAISVSTNPHASENDLLNYYYRVDSLYFTNLVHQLLTK